MSKTYAEYLAEDRKRPPSPYLAPAGARPKHKDVPVSRKKSTETTRRKVYKARGVSYGR